jgi:Flp pilus assembly protein TadG
MVGPPVRFPTRSLAAKLDAVSPRREERGQALVEFALLLPLLLLLVLGLVEFSFVWNSRNTVLFASRDASMLAAEGGSLDGTDCVVLSRIEGDIVSPAAAVRVLQVSIYWSDRNGDQIGSNVNVYDRTGSTTCDYGDGTTITVPYSLTSAGYPEGARCDVLAGCGGSHSTVDTIGVRVTYQHRWLTSFARLTGTGVTFTESTVNRAEPQL